MIAEIIWVEMNWYFQHTFWIKVYALNWGMTSQPDHYEVITIFKSTLHDLCFILGNHNFKTGLCIPNAETDEFAFDEAVTIFLFRHGSKA